MEKKSISRRLFVKQSALGAGAFGLVNPLKAENNKNTSDKLPRPVFLAGVCSEGLGADTSVQMIDLVEQKLQQVLPLRPDIVCTPEIFPFIGRVKQKMNVNQRVEFSKLVIQRFSKIAKQFNSWFICALTTNENNKNYNSAVVIDRNGNVKGEYRKIHTTINEMKSGISPGPPDPPVFETDFGKIGIQICFDIQWNDGWEKLQKKGAEIIFWPSAFAGGNLVNTRAWQHKAVIVSSTQKGISKICDVMGNEVSTSGHWSKNLVWGEVNLEKAVIHTWPYVKRFNDIQKKYERKIRISHLHEDEISVIESLSPEIRVKDILEEFDILTHVEHIEKILRMQNKARKFGIESLREQ